MIVLNPRQINSSFNQGFLLKGFRKETPGITMPFWLNDADVLDVSFDNVQNTALCSLIVIHSITLFIPSWESSGCKARARS